MFPEPLPLEWLEPLVVAGEDEEAESVAAMGEVSRDSD